jgi:hypothetical protein
MPSSCSTPISTREQGGLIGTGMGAGAGAIIGSTVGHVAAGALIGDHLMEQQKAGGASRRG